MSRRIQAVLLLAPYVVFAGHIYREGFSHGLGIPESLISVGADEYAYFGFMALVRSFGIMVSNSAYQWLIGFVVLAIFAALGGTTYGLIQRKLKVRFRRFRATAVRRYGKSLSAVLAFLVVGLSPFLAAMFFAYCLLPVALVERSGEKDAADLRAQLADSKKAAAYPVIFLGIENASRDAYPRDGAGNSEPSPGPELAQVASSRLIECRSEWCIAFVKGNFIILRKGDIRQIISAAQTL